MTEEAENKVVTLKYIFQFGRQFMYAEMKYNGRVLIEKSFASINNKEAEKFVNTGSL